MRTLSGVMPADQLLPFNCPGPQIRGAALDAGRIDDESLPTLVASAAVDDDGRSACLCGCEGAFLSQHMPLPPPRRFRITKKRSFETEVRRSTLPPQGWTGWCQSLCPVATFVKL
jgi:hypothetical protein